MTKKMLPLFSVLMVAIFVLAACAQPAAPTKAPVVVEEPAAPVATDAPVVEAEPVTIVLWTKEGEADGGLQYVTSLTDAYTVLYPNVTFEVVNKEVETLREDFQTASLAGDPPDLLWTVSDHAGPFTVAGLIQPVDDLVDLSKYVSSVEMNGATWAVPISAGNHLMLMYNKALVPTPPATTEELITIGTALTNTAAGTYGLAFNQTEPFWLSCWLLGFDASFFAEDGVTPTLDTPEMTAALQFLYDIKYTTPIIPLESDYNGAETLFKEGKAGMLINGDWSIGGYKEVLGDNFGVAPLPKVSSTGLMPGPLTSGVYFMVPESLEGAKLDAVVDFMDFATNLENQTALVETLARLPGLIEAQSIPAITEDPLLKASTEAMSYGSPMPTVLEIRCIWDSMKPEMQAMLANTKTAADAAAAAQTAAEACIISIE